MLTEEKKEEKKQVKEKKKQPLRGIVSHTLQLYLREEPSFDAKAEMILMEGTDFEIDPDFVDYDWYKVLLQNGKVGYVNKPYVEVKE